MTRQFEFAAKSNLIQENGELSHMGWSRQPVLECNLDAAAPQGIPKFLRPWRVKKWDYYAFFSPTHFFSITLADIGYAGSVFAYLLDYKTSTLTERTVTVPFAKGISLARDSWEGTSSFKNAQVDVKFSVQRDARTVRLSWPNFAGKDLTCDLTIAPKDSHESMAIATPMGGRKFYWNRKIQCLPVTGIISWGVERWNQSPATTLGLLDWGRGIWPYRSRWVWASGSMFTKEGGTLGLNLGDGFGDTSRATENCVVVDGRIHKLSQVAISFNPKDYLQSWTMKDEEERLNLVFIPSKERVAKTNLTIAMTEVHQIFGHYEGSVKLDDGRTLAIEGMRGFAEEHHARW